MSECLITSNTTNAALSSTYDHRTLNIELPVRSAVLKQCTGGLVVRWVTTGESPLSYVFVFVLLGSVFFGGVIFARVTCNELGGTWRFGLSPTPEAWILVKLAS